MQLGDAAKRPNAMVRKDVGLYEHDVDQAVAEHLRHPVRTVFHRFDDRQASGGQSLA